MIGRLNHVAIAVPDLAAASALYRGTLGAEVSEPLDLPEHGVTTVFVNLPQHEVGAAASARRGLADSGLPRQGIRRAASITSATRWRTSWRRATGWWPKARGCWATASRATGAHGKPVIFLHPKDFCGTLVELEQV